MEIATTTDFGREVLPHLAVYSLPFVREDIGIAIVKVFHRRAGAHVGHGDCTDDEVMKPKTTTRMSPKKSILTQKLPAFLLMLVALAASPMAQAQTLLVQLVSTNYNATTGVWTDSSGNGNNATATGTKPSLATGATPNGSPAVVFTGANPMGLASSIPVGSYTVLAYVQPASGAGPYAVLGGTSGSFEYRIYNSKQDNLRQQQADLGSESTAMSTSAFNVIGTILTSTGISFRLNGANDGTNTVSPSLTQPISAIGARASSGGENFSGSIGEIDIYSGVLTPAQITAVEASFTNKFITIPSTAPIIVSQTAANPTTATVGGNDTLTASFTGGSPISYQWQVSANSNGAGATGIAGQTNTTLVLSNLQLSSSGLYYSLRATNNIAPYATNSSWLQLNVVALTPLVQLIATNYDGSSVWTDSSGNGNNATYSGSTPPTLLPFVTPNGGSAVNIASGSGQSFLFSTSLPTSTSTGSGYTVFAYVKPSVVADGGRHSLTGGSSSGALEYDIYNSKQDYLREYLADVGSGTLTVTTNSFSILNLAVNSSGATFRLNGTNDATVSGSTFSSPITRVGNNEGGGDGYFGQIAEIDIYSGALTLTQITNIEAQLTAKYITANSIVIGPSTVSPTNNTYAGNPITLAASVIGATGTTTYQWQTDNGSGGASYSNIGGAVTTNYLLNTTSLNGTYQYRLIGTPFGGSPATNLPVTLTVNPASAPVILADTSISPSPATVGGNATLSASFVGNLPITYQWQYSANASGSPATSIAGATNATLVLSNLQLINSGVYYSLRASNAVAPNVVNSTWTQLTVVPLTALVQLVSTNYNPSVGVWTDSSGNGNNATYSGATTPTLTPLATPNGTPAVNVSSGSGSFLLASSLDPSVGYTVFAYVMPSNTSGRRALTGGSYGSGYALEYDIYNGIQDYLIEYQSDVGHGNGTISTTNFSLLDLAVNSSGASFRLNGAADGSVAGATFSQPITRIGNNTGGGDGYVGQIAEIDIYSGVLSSIQISNIEAQLTANYVTVGGIVIGAANVSPTNTTFAGNTVTLTAPVIGASGTTSFQWQTDNASGGAAFSNIGGANSTNYVLNTTGLNGTYLYQLIGTPFGGNSVTSAPLSLTVIPASAPVVAVDTAINPNPATVGGNATLSASFTGNLPITYQWQVSANASGSPATSIAGATNTTLVLTNLQLSSSGKYYSLRASNSIAPNVVNSSWTQLTVQPLAGLVQLVATNYNPVSGVWTDSSGNANNATYTNAVYTTSVNPTLDSLVTPAGGSAVDITVGGGSFLLTSPLDPSLGYTVLAYVKPSNTSGRNALTGGSAAGALEYDIYNGKQDYLREYLQDVGSGNATIPATGFSLIGLAVNSSGAAFRLNGASDGNVAGATFNSPITRIGNNEGNGDSYVGDIAEIDIYSGALSTLQITNLEAQFVAKYGVVGVATNPTNIMTTVSGNVLTLSWPADHIGWRLQVQTNSLSTGLGSGWTDVAGSTSVDSVSVTVNPANGTVFYRMVYP